MTREEKIRILDNATNLTYRLLERAYQENRGVDEIQTTLGILSYIECFADRLKCVPPGKEVTEEFSISAAVSPVPPPAPEPEVTPEPEPEGEDEPKYKMEEVRAALAKARGRGVNVSEIIRSFGADNFQQITPDQYPAVMAKLEGAGA